VISKFPGVLNGPPDRVDGDPCEVEDVLEEEEEVVSELLEEEVVSELLEEEVVSELPEEVVSELLDELLEPPRPKL
jgi:hypothetical protein